MFKNQQENQKQKRYNFPIVATFQSSLDSTYILSKHKKNSYARFRFYPKDPIASSYPNSNRADTPIFKSIGETTTFIPWPKGIEKREIGDKFNLVFD